MSNKFTSGRAIKERGLGKVGLLGTRFIMEGIVLACTELPLLIQTSDIPVPLFDTTHLHAEAAVKLALAE